MPKIKAKKLMYQVLCTSSSGKAYFILDELFKNVRSAKKYLEEMGEDLIFIKLLTDRPIEVDE